MAVGAFSPALSLAATVEVAGAQLNTDAARTELVLSLSAPAEHSLFTLAHPDRIVVDVDGATLSTALPAGQGVIGDLRSGMHEGSLRLVLDLTARATPRSFERSGPTGPELVIDLYTARAGAGPQRTVPPPASAVAVSPVSMPVGASDAPATPAHGREIVVAIDAGHGGRDPGAHGPHGALEKNATLAIALKLAALVDQQPGMKAVLTRDRDVLVPLRDRFQKARRAHADLFISIHCDASRDRSADGATVYVLSEHGASTEHAKAVADRENYEELVGGVDLSDESPQVRSVLVDMSQTAAMSDSFEAGSSVARQLAAMGAMHRNSVQQAGFMVLKAPDVPSMLVETNYITNARAAKLLMTPDYQARLAQAIATGVRQYFERYPPPGTELALTRQQTVADSVVAGDAGLSVVARPHR